MRLSELSPWWITQRGRRIGLLFLCPRCVQKGVQKPTFLSAFWNSPKYSAGDCEDSQYGLFARMLEEMGPERARGNRANDVVPCKRGYNWKIESGSTFDDLTLKPSLNAEAAGHWHGHITKGAIT